MATIVVNRVPEKLCLSGKVICGRKGRRLKVDSGTLIECRNAWGCRYQVDMDGMPAKKRREWMQLATVRI